jgi:hypothetical protein
MTTPDPPRFYFDIAWDMVLARDDADLRSLIGQALRDYDHSDIMYALAIAGYTLSATVSGVTAPSIPRRIADDHLTALSQGAAT